MLEDIKLENVKLHMQFGFVACLLFLLPQHCENKVQYVLTEATIPAWIKKKVIWCVCEILFRCVSEDKEESLRWGNETGMFQAGKQ